MNRAHRPVDQDGVCVRQANFSENELVEEEKTRQRTNICFTCPTKYFYFTRKFNIISLFYQLEIGCNLN